MKKFILVACECSQTVCLAWRREGFGAFSCDLQDCYGDLNHYAAPTP